MKKMFCLLLLFALLLCLPVSCVDPQKTTGSAETTTITDSAESQEPNNPPQSTQPDLPPDDNWTKIY